MRNWILLLALLITPAAAAPDSIEGFAFGGSADEIVSRLGEPSGIDGPTYEKRTRSWIWTWDYTRYGAQFEVEAESQDGSKVIRSLTIVPPCPWKLSSGIGLGDTSDKIEAAYTRVQRPSDRLWFAKSGKLVTGFELVGAKIMAIYLGSKP